jgi:hypothetical protein
MIAPFLEIETGAQKKMDRANNRRERRERTANATSPLQIRRIAGRVRAASSRVVATRPHG